MKSAVAEKLMMEADLLVSQAQLKKYNNTVAELQQKASKGQISAAEFKAQLLEANKQLVSKAKMSSVPVPTPAPAPPTTPAPTESKPFREWGAKEKQLFNDAILAMARAGQNDKQIHAALGKVCSLSYVFKVRNKAGLPSSFVAPVKKVVEPLTQQRPIDNQQASTPPPVVPLVEREARFQEMYPGRRFRHRPASFYFPTAGKLLQINFYDKQTDSWVMLVSRQSWSECKDAALSWMEEYPVMKLVLINMQTLSEFLPSAVDARARVLLHRNYVAFAQSEQLGD